MKEGASSTTPSNGSLGGHYGHYAIASDVRVGYLSGEGFREGERPALDKVSGDIE